MCSKTVHNGTNVAAVSRELMCTCIVFVTFTRCRISYTLRVSSPDVANDDVKYDVSNYARPPATTTTTTFWTSTSRPPCQHWPQCNPGLCLASAGHRSSRLHRSDPHILLSPVAADSLEWDALDSNYGRPGDSTDGCSSSTQRSRCLLHSPSAEVVSVDLS